MSSRPRLGRSVAVGGDIRDSVLVLGDNNVIEVALGDDAILRRRLATEQVMLERRVRPLNKPPPPFSDHVDRETELAAIADAPGHVNVHGPSGIGKTYVLLAALPSDAVYVDSAQRPLDDLLQALVEELFDTSPGLILSTQRRRRELCEVDAIVALDDVRLAPQDGQRLFTEAPKLRYVVASRQRALMHAHRVRIGGLPPEFGLALLAEELGRALRRDEQEGAAALAERLGGHPLMLRQAAGLAAETGVSLGALADALGSEAPVRALSARLQAALSPEDHELIVQLATVSGAPLAPSCAMALGAPADAAVRLGALEARGLVQSHSPRYTLAGALAEAPPSAGVADPNHAANTLADWAQRRSHQEILDESAALLAVLQDAQGPAAARLARALDRPLALGRRWGSWGTALEAARAAGEVSTEAWALHQLGTRAYAFEDNAADAIQLLERALAIREELGEAREAANTRHNLEFIRGGPLRDDDDDQPHDGGGGSGIRALVAGAVAVVAAALIAAVALGGRNPQDIDDPGPGGEGDPPSVTISAPGDGAIFAAGAVIRARFECTGVTCKGSVRHGKQRKAVATGTRLPNDRGRYTLTVTATGAEGEITRESAVYTVRSAICGDRKDNDKDGLTDLEDRGCAGAADEDETDPAAAKACADDSDNDGDGRTDLEDPGCSRSTDNDESDAPKSNACADGKDNDQDGRTDTDDPGCGSASDDDEMDPDKATACADDEDNDQDGLTDTDDAGCESASDDDEADPAAKACADDKDNDADGLTDTDDPGCASTSDDDETDPPSACSDKQDNDDDDLIDLNDGGCVNAADTSEASPDIE